jgi:outer membrane protein assembly factor BamB
MIKILDNRKISTIALIAVLTISTLVLTLPSAKAQNLIMNCDNQAILNFNFDVDLNGPSEQLEGLKFAYKRPGATEFVLTTDFPIDNEPGLPGERYVTDPGGDCDIDVIFDEVGIWEVKWVLPSTGAESNTVAVEVLLEVTQESFPYIGAIPNPVGVNQLVLLHIGVMEPETRVDRGWEGLTVSVERPDGTTDTLGPYNTDSTGGTGGTFTPTMIGTYKLQTHFPKQQKSDGVSFLEAESEILELVVQEEAIPYYPGHSLPSEYWTRPIDAQLREWYTIAGHWLQNPQNLYAPYNDDAPDTAHILWTKPIAMGGLAGGEVGDHGFVEGDAYEGKWSRRFIMAGRLYYTVGGSRGEDLEVTHCVDLHTGEELWSKVFLDNRTISFCQTLFWDSFNMHGVYNYLWITRGRTWYAFDGFTGDWRFTWENMPSGTRMFGPKGEIYILIVNRGAGKMSLWSMAGRIEKLLGSSAGSWGNNVDGRVNDASHPDNILWEVDIPADLSGNPQRAWYGDRVVGASVSNTEVSLWGLSLEPGHEGAVLFQNTWQAPAYWEEGSLTVSGFGGGWMIWSQEDRVAVLWAKETREYFGFSLETGEYMWGPTEPEYYINAVDDTPSASRAAGYGNFYCLSLSGIVYAYDLQTGDTVWTYEAEDPYQEFLFANNWWGKTMFVTDGKVYLGSLEHSPIDPKPRGAPFYCLDAETGEVIWRANGLFRQTRWGGRAIIGDSIIAAMDTYDQRIYAIGKGPSQITVEAPLTASAWGQKIVLRGRVTDVSPGTETPGIKMRFPNGVPAVSDGDMSAWMRYVYKQFSCPMVSGVPVKLEVVVDPNYNWYDIGVAYTDASGFYSIEWEPPVPGHYLILASFEGSKAYYPSYVETSVIVDEGLTPGALMETEFLPSTGTEQQTVVSVISTETVIIAAVAIALLIGLSNYLGTRKRK